MAKIKERQVVLEGKDVMMLSRRISAVASITSKVCGIDIFELAVGIEQWGQEFEVGMGKDFSIRYNQQVGVWNYHSFVHKLSDINITRSGARNSILIL